MPPSPQGGARVALHCTANRAESHGVASGLDDIDQVPLRDRRFRDLAPCPEPPRFQHGFNVPLKLGWRPDPESREARARYVHESKRLIYHSAPLLEHIAMPKTWHHVSAAVPL